MAYLLSSSLNDSKRASFANSGSNEISRSPRSRSETGRFRRIERISRVYLRGSTLPLAAIRRVLATMRLRCHAGCHATISDCACNCIAAKHSTRRTGTTTCRPKFGHAPNPQRGSITPACFEFADGVQVGYGSIEQLGISRLLPACLPNVWRRGYQPGGREGLDDLQVASNYFQVRTSLVTGARRDDCATSDRDSFRLPRRHDPRSREEVIADSVRPGGCSRAREDPTDGRHTRLAA
jgi:hypothetical protein